VKKILILSANPQGTSPLRLDEEVREIDAGLQRAKNRDQFIIEQKWAVRPRDLLRAMLDSNPQIVHFCGHGMGDEGLVFADESGKIKLIDGEALAGLFKLFADQVECVVLNGCYSQVQAEVIGQHIDYVIGMKKAIGDKAAIEFAVGFYDALGNGRNIEFAYNFSCVAIGLAGISEQLTPILNQKPHLEQAGDNIKTQVSTQVSNIREFKSETLSVGNRQRLQIEYDELQQQYNSLTEEIQFLQKSQQTQHLDPKDQFRLKKQIEQANEERQNLSEKITALENKLA